MSPSDSGEHQSGLASAEAVSAAPVATSAGTPVHGSGRTDGDDALGAPTGNASDVVAKAAGEDLQDAVAGAPAVPSSRQGVHTGMGGAADEASASRGAPSAGTPAQGSGRTEGDALGAPAGDRSDDVVEQPGDGPRDAVAGSPAVPSSHQGVHAGMGDAADEASAGRGASSAGTAAQGFGDRESDALGAPTKDSRDEVAEAAVEAVGEPPGDRGHGSPSRPSPDLSAGDPGNPDNEASAGRGARSRATAEAELGRREGVAGDGDPPGTPPPPASDGGAAAASNGNAIASLAASAPAPSADEGADEGSGTADGEAAEVASLCRLMVDAADRHGVPHDFFIRLIWKESRFNPNAVSPVGAQGIAQFMPTTARLRGLADPFDREAALFASAHFLADLKARFGSWGLAAAGYNGGPNRVPPFVAGRAGLPYETIDYVYAITGRTAKYWALAARRAAVARAATAVLALSPIDVGLHGPTGERSQTGTMRPVAQFWPPLRMGLEPMTRPLSDVSAPFPPLPRPDRASRVDCPVLVAALGRARSVSPPGVGSAGFSPWGAQVAGHPQRHVAMRQYGRLRPRLPQDLVARGPHVVVRRFAARGRLPIHAVQFSAASRGEAEALCQRIARARAPCVVVKNG
ncbi:transglycosylase SLT domain-containing protein [Acuticoccus sp.]|uniref:transglycosylase SLT domain-containing protein n=1 Tax=Acuticoccus sp. TaxID=1904378 RepID=UPI003B51A810